MNERYFELAEENKKLREENAKLRDTIVMDIGNKPMKLWQLVEDTEKTKTEIRQIVDALQLKLQPGGSPPSGGPVILAAWIINEASARIRELEEKLLESRK